MGYIDMEAWQNLTLPPMLCLLFQRLSSRPLNNSTAIMRILLYFFGVLAFLVVGLHALASDESFPSCTVGENN